MQHIFRVGEITRALKDVVEGQFPFVWVRGQVSNLARPSSGHVYFSLKDEEAVLNVVWFKGSQDGLSLNSTERYDPLTGEVLEGPKGASWLADGADVLCAGRLTVYAPRGAYQLVAELVQDMGLGRLYLEFEALKIKLTEKGWFDSERKRPLPAQPLRVAVVTAPAAAAVRDFLRVGRARGTGCEIRIFPTLVQGDQAPGQIAEALDAAGSDGWAQVVVLLRGGGSIEDLWAFNTEMVAEAIFNCPVPVVCGVGHEVDVTIADMVADVRAATPSHAAQLLWPERSVLAQRADELEMRLRQAFERFARELGGRLAHLEKALSWLSPRERLERLDERLESLTRRLQLSSDILVSSAHSRLDSAVRELSRAGQNITVSAVTTLSDLERRLLSFGPAWLESSERRLDGLSQRLSSSGGLGLERTQAKLDVLVAKLNGLDPRKPLERGYALARRANGSFLRSVDEVAPGEGIDIIVRDGTVKTTVADVERSST
ncbi:MAG: exodeoxyribonuclease VII large subunit [Desulfovibrio sp.]|nr:exodeoxyribonuclease VII large subunit [Desulfovibrio sp.]